MVRHVRSVARRASWTWVQGLRATDRILGWRRGDVDVDGDGDGVGDGDGETERRGDGNGDGDGEGYGQIDAQRGERRYAEIQFGQQQHHLGLDYSSRRKKTRKPNGCDAVCCAMLCNAVRCGAVRAVQSVPAAGGGREPGGQVNGWLAVRIELKQLDRVQHQDARCKTQDARRKTDDCLTGWLLGLLQGC